MFREQGGKYCDAGDAVLDFPCRTHPVAEKIANYKYQGTLYCTNLYTLGSESLLTAFSRSVNRQYAS